MEARLAYLAQLMDPILYVPENDDEEGIRQIAILLLDAPNLHKARLDMRDDNEFINEEPVKSKKEWMIREARRRIDAAIELKAYFELGTRVVPSPATLGVYFRSALMTVLEDERDDSTLTELLREHRHLFVHEPRLADPWPVHLPKWPLYVRKQDWEAAVCRKARPIAAPSRAKPATSASAPSLPPGAAESFARQVTSADVTSKPTASSSSYPTRAGQSSTRSFGPPSESSFEAGPSQPTSSFATNAQPTSSSATPPHTCPAALPSPPKAAAATAAPQTPTPQSTPPRRPREDHTLPEEPAGQSVPSLPALGCLAYLRRVDSQARAYVARA